MTREGASPPTRRVLLRTLVTAVLAAAVVAWSVRGVAWSEVGQSLRGADLPLTAVCVLVFAASFGTVDVLAFGRVWRAHLDPTVPWRDVRALVLGKQLLFTTVPLLTKTVPPAYFWRRRGLPLARVVGASELVSAAELVVVLGIASLTALLGPVDLDPVLTAVLLALWVLLVGGALWVRRPRPAGTGDGPGLLHALRTARTGDLLGQVGLRLVHQAVALVCVTVLLHGWGATPTLAQVLTFGPLFLVSGTLPISLGGYGGPQGVAVALLADAWGLLSAADALAFSLVWSTAVLLTQLATGLVHLPRLATLVRRSPATA